MTRVAIVDDHRLFAASLAVALRSDSVDVVTPWLSTLPALQGALVSMDPDVVMLDRDLGPLGSGEALIAPMTAMGAAVVVVSARVDELVAGRCLASGAVAYLDKTAPLDVLRSTLLAVARGERPVGDTERARLVESWVRHKAEGDAAAAPFAGLTRREEEVLGELITGKTVRAIAASSYVSEATVRTQVRSILAKLRVGSQLEAVGLARRTGWAPRPPDVCRGAVRRCPTAASDSDGD